MTFRKLVGIAALGGFYYAHRKRGGQMTLDSIKQTARSLVDNVKNRAETIREKVDQNVGEGSMGRGEFASGSDVSGAADVTGYGSPGYGYGDVNRKY